MDVRISDRQRELLDGAERIAYKDLGAGESLDLFVFSPQDVGTALPVLVFFYGGGFWERGALSQFAPQALHFADRGCVSLLVDYRLGRKRGTSPLDGVEDARDAVAWVAANARRLGVDVSKIVLAGASSGAYVALASMMDMDNDAQASVCEPAALVLFSPIVNLVRDNAIKKFGDKKLAKQASPLHQVRKGLPPMLIFHGTVDRDQVVSEVETFAKKASRKKNVCELNLFKGEGSSYFNFNVNANLYEATLNTMDDFMIRVGALDGGVDGAATTRLDSWR